MIITVVRFIRPDNIRTEVVAEIALPKRKASGGLGVERYVVKVAEETFELTAHFAPHDNTLSLQLEQKQESIVRVLVCCATPCELTFRLPSAQRVGFFCDARHTDRRLPVSAVARST
jgi:hypothetical protein